MGKLMRSLLALYFGIFRQLDGSPVSPPLEVNNQHVMLKENRLKARIGQRKSTRAQMRLHCSTRG
jgi:hypothetical protein